MDYRVPPAPALNMTDAQIAEAKRAIREHYRLRRWAAGQNYRCPSCKMKKLVGRDDLSHEFARGSTLVVYRNLKGALCGNCGARFLESGEIMALEDEGERSWRADFETKVTTIGRESLGTYWPRDVVRNTRMKKDTVIRIEVIDPKTLVLHLQ